MSDLAWKFKLALGVLMIGLGSYVAIRPLLPGHRAITPSRWLDVVFAAFFIIRGAMHVRAALRKRTAR